MARQFVVDRFAELLDLPVTDTKCINLEKTIHNWAILKSKELCDVPASDNHRHVNRYKTKFLEIQTCMRKAPTLKDDIVSGKLKVSDIVTTPPHVLWPDGPLAIQINESVKKSMKKDYNVANEINYKGAFKCGKCRQWKTTYYEMQTRSADEPTTVFITCHLCNSHWKL